jgi:hypothetical protein
MGKIDLIPSQCAALARSQSVPVYKQDHGCPQSRAIVSVTSKDISSRIRQFAAYVGVPHHEGIPWRFTPHQFRKTFARLVARRDRSQLMVLADHFKHASIAMTAKGYVGNDFDLEELIDHEGQAETALALDRLLTSDRLAGRMGERILAENAAFRGRAGEQVRRDYVANDHNGAITQSSMAFYLRQRSRRSKP